MKILKQALQCYKKWDYQAKNWSFHCCKMMWLIAQERTEGLYSTVQCKVTNNNILFHLGMSRIYSLMYLEAWDKSVVVWDVGGNVTDREPLTLEQHLNIFDIPDQHRFAGLIMTISWRYILVREEI